MKPRIITYSYKNIDKWKAQQQKDKAKIEKYDGQEGLIRKYQGEIADIDDDKHAEQNDANSENLRQHVIKLKRFKREGDRRVKDSTQNEKNHAEHIDEAEKFLNDLANDPSAAFYRLHDDILNSLNKYDETHPIQDVGIRLCLYGLREKLRKIISDQKYSNIKADSVEAQKENWRIKIRFKRCTASAVRELRRH